ncbi:DUF3644 domain-containing protein [Saccharophagus degradans]|uniref:DUF3644 domain-containing protein n=1 Tax=Saccharophagus degradans (strain 2-40 / ATCC 43961 / DSM 17024) TaxID=203122 RepID=Q21NM1_SACD2|nr:DUF3644 domain-containing protein [Saccharophagus degradans]ABD79708.1 conserved hypothetical protein [Saccharophagus degradans 2-40]
MKSRARSMLDKSIAAMLSAIEIYNKPDFNYREETFSVLCINAWELLLKAKVLQLARNQVTSLYVWEYRELKAGGKSKKKYIKNNRAGNPMSVSLFEAHRIITEEYGVKINNAVKTNIATLAEIRDNSIHFINDDLSLSIKVQEIGTASLQNYLHLVQEWFGPVLDKYNFYLMPMAFFRGFDSVNGETLNASEKNLLKYIKSVEKEYDNEALSDYNLSLRIDVNFKKVKSGSGIPVQITNDAKAPVVRLAEEEIMDKYPWDYDVLTTRLKKRYSDFKANAEYHSIRKSHENNEKYCHQRLYNPSNPNSGSKAYFNPNILKEFDKHYTKQS